MKSRERLIAALSALGQVHTDPWIRGECSFRTSIIALIRIVDATFARMRYGKP